MTHLCAFFIFVVSTKEMLTLSLPQKVALAVFHFFVRHPSTPLVLLSFLFKENRRQSTIQKAVAISTPPLPLVPC